MREIDTEVIQEAVKELFMKANYFLNDDIMDSLKIHKDQEVSEIGKEILGKIIENAELAANKEIAMCQDTGMCIIYVEIGQEVILKGQYITDAINSGVRQAYQEGFMRKSVVADPLRRKNTGDNTPAVIYYDFVKGNNVKLQVMPKGFGSENMSTVKMLKPSDGVAGVIDFVVEAVRTAGSNPCPPIIVGVGIGGTMDKAAYLSKRALLRPINIPHPDCYYEELEKTLLDKINNLGIGPQGLGGITTALAVNIETFPTHIAGLPVAVNITCHASRHEEMTI